MTASHPASRVQFSSMALPTEAEQANEDAYFGVTWEDKTTANWHNLLRYGGLRLRSQYTEFAPAGTADESGYTARYLGACHDSRGKRIYRQRSGAGV